MEESSVSSAVQSNSIEVKHNETNDTVKPTNRIVNGNPTFPNDRQVFPGKTMHVMTPGPKTYQNVKKSPDKEPKFVPYEPYKAAVRSIVPELSQPSVAIFKRRLSTTSTASKVSNAVEEKEDEIKMLSLEKQVKLLLIILFSYQTSVQTLYFRI